MNTAIDSVKSDVVLHAVLCPHLLCTSRLSQIEHDWHGGLMCTEGQGI